MALLETPLVDTSVIAPDFTLKNIDGEMISLKDVQGPKGTLIIFMCNHCPYVLAIIDRLIEDVKALQSAGIGCAAIMPNDAEHYPADSFENMKKFADKYGMTFQYLIDETQDIARAYDAVCTPDLFGFNADGALRYRGRVDSAGLNPVTDDTVRELQHAMLEIAQTGTTATKQTPSMGCSIKWK